MNRKPDRTMLYIAGSVVLLILAIAATSIINSRTANDTDIRARASVQSGLEYEATISTIDFGNRTLTVDALKPLDNNMALAGTWSVQVASDISMEGLSEGARVKLIIDSKEFSIQNRSMGVKKIDPL